VLIITAFSFFSFTQIKVLNNSTGVAGVKILHTQKHNQMARGKKKRKIQNVYGCNFREEV